MKVELYTHGDFDGIASAAILYRFFYECGHEITHIETLSYIDLNEQEWHSKLFDNICCVSDFVCPKNITSAPFWVWADHHASNSPPSSSENGFVIYDPTAKSCAGLLAPLTPELKELGEWADVIDSASYSSAHQALFSRDAAMTVNFALTLAPKKLRISLIKNLAFRSLEEIASEPNIQKLADSVRRRNYAATEYLRYNARIVKGRYTVGIAFFPHARIQARYAILYTHPDVDFYIYTRPVKNKFSLSVAINRFKHTHSPIPLGDLLQTIGGGGHNDVAAITLQTKEEALILSTELASLLSSL